MTSKTRYKEQYRQMRHNGNNILKPPHVLDEVETNYMPGSVRLRLQGTTDLIHHTPVKAGQAHIEYGPLSFEPDVIQSEMYPGFDAPPPNFQGVHWDNSHALAKTLEEQESDIASGLHKCGISPEKDIQNLMTVKDGADGMGNISIFREASDILLPDKAFRAAFAIIRCEVMKDGERTTVYEPSDLNSVTITRLLIGCTGDENNSASAKCMLHTMERQRELSININNRWRRHKVMFYNSMIDEKLDRADCGLQGSGSKYLYTLCQATRQEARAAIGSFEIDRSVEEVLETASYVIVNPDKRPSNELADAAQGVKEFPVFMSTPRWKLLDATLDDITFGSFF
ncbi:V(D)J recombination-activating protein 1-like [Strongylocentrotus purpuratus]|uniref:Uncharacterized protein n=1 Tax=Strongylocentrotus purpuratus TaxID=7668 RepID=A0A7M7N5R8_STRPU|nr:V(D)J recombination-activating protein 1-like [Strongylocentrotus purpuratus]